MGVGGELRGLVKDGHEEVRTASRMIERIVGRFGGFDLGIVAARGDETPNLYLAGHCLYNAETLSNGSGPGGRLAGCAGIGGQASRRRRDPVGNSPQAAGRPPAGVGPLIRA